MKRPDRRWIVVGAAAAAAVAIAVPVLLLGGDTPGGGRQATPAAPGGPPSASVSPSPTASPSGPARTRLRGTYDLLENVVPGAPPAVPYLDRTTLVRPDGTTLAMPRRYDQLALVGDRIVTGYDDGQGNRAVDVLDADGGVLDSTLVEGNFAVNAESSLAAWAALDGTLEMLWPGGGVAFESESRSVHAAGVVGEAPCADADDGCRVFLNSWGSTPPVSVTPDGTASTVVPGALRLNDVRPDGTVAVQVSSTDTGSCSGVYDAGRTVPRWTTCRHSLFRFSPDGSYLLASDPYLDGIGLGSVSVLDAATGRPVVTFRIRGGFVAQQMWEDRTHPLVVVSGPDGWQILRLSLDGTRQRATGPVAADADPALKQLTLPGNV